MNPAIDFHALTFSYGSVPTPSGIDLQVVEDEFFVTGTADTAGSRCRSLCPFARPHDAHCNHAGGAAERSRPGIVIKPRPTGRPNHHPARGWGLCLVRDAGAVSRTAPRTLGCCEGCAARSNR